MSEREKTEIELKIKELQKIKEDLQEPRGVLGLSVANIGEGYKRWVKEQEAKYGRSEKTT